jgi:hypothetical protein
MSLLLPDDIIFTLLSQSALLSNKEYKSEFSGSAHFFPFLLYILWEKRAFDDGDLCVCSCAYASD